MFLHNLMSLNIKKNNNKRSVQPTLSKTDTVRTDPDCLLQKSQAALLLSNSTPTFHVPIPGVLWTKNPLFKCPLTVLKCPLSVLDRCSFSTEFSCSKITEKKKIRQGSTPAVLLKEVSVL